MVRLVRVVRVGQVGMGCMVGFRLPGRQLVGDLGDRELQESRELRACRWFLDFLRVRGVRDGSNRRIQLDA